jgi:hypothetical protein
MNFKEKMTCNSSSSKVKEKQNDIPINQHPIDVWGMLGSSSYLSPRSPKINIVFSLRKK